MPHSFNLVAVVYSLVDFLNDILYRGSIDNVTLTHSQMASILRSSTQGGNDLRSILFFGVAAPPYPRKVFRYVPDFGVGTDFTSHEKASAHRCLLEPCAPG